MSETRLDFVATAFRNVAGFVKTCFFPNWLPAILCALALLLCPRAEADSINRGVWFWNTPSSPYGANNIVGTGNSTLENQTVAQFQQWGINHVYGSYGNQLETAQTNNIATWNTLLSHNGLVSELLISDDKWRTGDAQDLTDLINFNKNQPAAAQFKAIHLDIEPQALSTWGTDNKYQDLVNLANTYQSVRSNLNANGNANIPIYADLPDWFDSLTAINWSAGNPSDPAAVRDQWFAGLSNSLTGITLMAYDQPTFPKVNSVVDWERNFYANGFVRVGLDVDEGFSDLNAMMTVADQVESTYGSSAGIDIYDYKLLEEAATVPEPWTLALLATGSLGLLAWTRLRPLKRRP